MYFAWRNTPSVLLKRIRSHGLETVMWNELEEAIKPGQLFRDRLNVVQHAFIPLLHLLHIYKGGRSRGADCSLLSSLVNGVKFLNAHLEWLTQERRIVDKVFVLTPPLRRCHSFRLWLFDLVVSDGHLLLDFANWHLLVLLARDCLGNGKKAHFIN